MKIMAIEQELSGVTAADMQPFLRDEAAAVWEMYAGGIIREIYFTAESHAAVLFLECDSRAEAETTLATLPLVRAGFIQFKLYTLEPYTGLARLFAD
jgi:hypothetical protein